MVIVGIDPGLDGGIAGIDEKGSVLFIRVMPSKEWKRGKRDVDAAELGRMLDRTNGERFDEGEPNLVVVEKVGSMPKQGIVGAFTFGKGYGKVLGIVEYFGIPLEQPTPQRWKKVVLAGTAKDKEAAVAYVRNRFPNLNLFRTNKCRKPHHGMADAVCLAEFGRRLLLGK